MRTKALRERNDAVLIFLHLGCIGQIGGLTRLDGDAIGVFLGGFAAVAARLPSAVPVGMSLQPMRSCRRSSLENLLTITCKCFAALRARHLKLSIARPKPLSHAKSNLDST